MVFFGYVAKYEPHNNDVIQIFWRYTMIILIIIFLFLMYFKKN